MQTMNCSQIESLITDYVLGLLNRGETDAVRAHLDQGCAKCNEALHQTAEALASLADDELRVAPPENCKQELFNRIRQGKLAQLQGEQGAESSASTFASVPTTPPREIIDASAQISHDVKPSRRPHPDLASANVNLGRSNLTQVWQYAAALACGLLLGWSVRFLIRANNVQESGVDRKLEYAAAIGEERKRFPVLGVTLVSTTVPSALAGKLYLAWDRIAGQAQFQATFDTTIPPTQTLVLWLSMDGESWKAAGPLQTDHSSQASGIVDVSNWAQPAKFILVSREELPSSSSALPPTPSRQILISCPVEPQPQP